MTLSSRHRIRNSSPGGLRPSTLPLGHGVSRQYWLSHVDGEETFFVSLTAETGNRTPNSGVKGSGANHYPRAPARCTSYRGCRPTHHILVHWASVVAHCWFNAEQSSTALNQHKSITGSAVYLAQTRGIHPMMFWCWTTVFDAGPTLKQHWVIVPCFLTAALICGWSFSNPAPETPDTRCIGPMLM